ncbi:hypothetical protein [Oceaniglobus indicus]|uniref:hypothetical protein n=1 Tax=Oceaniglobus indicus TaxID=2047749 RepID=UPI0011AB38E7|nr:hypothetical protein [Oceaniglobus indicus]
MGEKRLRSLEPRYNWFDIAAPSWRSIRTVIDHSAIRRLYVWLLIVPTLAKIFNNAPERLTFGPFSEAEYLTLLLQFPFTWYYYYFSAVLFFVTYILYLIGCPKFIKEFRGPTSVVASGETLATLTETVRSSLFKFHQKPPYYYSISGSYLREISYPYGQPNPEAFREWHDTGTVQNWNLMFYLDQPQVSPNGLVNAGTERYLGPQNAGKQEIEKEQFIKEISGHLFLILDYANLHFRILCAALILVGALALIIPSVQGLSFVIRSFLSSFG